MASSDVIDYISGQLKINVDKETIKTALLSRGWSQMQVDEAFAQINSVEIIKQDGPDMQNPVVSAFMDKNNSSGMGDSALVPEEVNGVELGWVCVCVDLGDL